MKRIHKATGLGRRQFYIKERIGLRPVPFALERSQCGVIYHVARVEYCAVLLDATALYEVSQLVPQVISFYMGERFGRIARKGESQLSPACTLGLYLGSAVLLLVKLYYRQHYSPYLGLAGYGLRVYGRLGEQPAFHRDLLSRYLLFAAA